MEFMFSQVVYDDQEQKQKKKFTTINTTPKKTK